MRPGPRVLPATPVAPPPGWRDRLLAWRHCLIASPRFQRLAAAFPPTRPIARRNARALFDLCAGFVYAQVLAAALRLDLFRLLADGPMAPEAIASRLDLPPDRALCLLRAAASLGLLTALRDGRFALGDLGAALLGNPSVAAMVAHHAMLYDDLRDPEALLRGTGGPTRLSAYWAYAGADDPAGVGEAAVAPYGALMGASQALVARDILDAYPLRRHTHLLDVGGGEGAFAVEAARSAPDLRITLFDLPPVAARAGRRFADEGLAGRAAALGGSFHAGLPRGADVVSLVRVVHDHNDAPALALLRSAREALPPGGTLLLAEPMAGTPGAEPVGDAYFGLYLLAMGSGRPRTAAELSGMLAEAGFGSVREHPTRRPMLVRLLSATAAPGPAPGTRA
ncbi:methyltransferase [Methylobacterium variabile]|jgi:demethylspheroidene O-methyltransferase|uniref:Methyltransferase n=1 Tax=Methylobacterium variabile TaxID=298794 RepID=A0A0J6SQA5_9HYPH|nr:methyltransferase [Methylobacterium variabile]KMO35874.1 methyltransferase [Methylobacterium variabile]